MQDALLKLLFCQQGEIKIVSHLIHVFLHGYVTLQREYVRGVHSWICNSHDLGKTDAVVSLGVVCLGLCPVLFFNLLKAAVYAEVIIR